MYFNTNQIFFDAKEKIAEMYDRINRDSSMVCLFDPSISSLNLGDQIIMYYTKNILEDLMQQNNFFSAPIHRCPSGPACRKIAKSNYKFLCGTNIICADRPYGNWNIPSDFYGYRDIVCIGVGMGGYYTEINSAAKKIYKKVFSKKYIHSVRDTQTLNFFKEIGINNVILTGCPTLWKLTKEHCTTLPDNKADVVVTTVTDYCRDHKRDKHMIDCLLRDYKKVFLWHQGVDDISYLKSFCDISRINFINNSLEDYNDFLKNTNCDYVGTRLHAGINALNYRKRSIVISIDNRAREMAKDFDIPIIERNNIDSLHDIINAPYKCDITIPSMSIEKWCSQFASR